MLRKLFIASLLVTLAALTAIPSAGAAKPTPGAQGNKPATPPGVEKRHAYFGTVTEIGATSFMIEPKKGDEVTILVNDATRIHIPGFKEADIEDVDIGDRVAVNGTPTADGLLAKKVAVAPGKPITVHRVGVVTAVSETELSVTDKKDFVSVFVLTEDTVVKGKGEEIQVDDLVTVIARRVPADANFTATAVVIHPAK